MLDLQKGPCFAQGMVSSLILNHPGLPGACRNIQPSAEYGDLAGYPTQDVPDNYPVKVNEDAMTVTVQGGIILRVLLDYLAIYT